jgi:hypothetical protein
MPCDQVRRSRVALREITNNRFDVGKVDRDLLNHALHEGLKIPLGACVYDGETLTIRSVGGKLRLTLDQIKVAYSQQVVESQARRQGWQLRLDVPETNELGERQYVYRKAV